VIACTAATPAARQAAWQACGAEVLVVAGAGPRVDLPRLLTALGARGLNTLLVEGGGEVLAAFFAAGLVDRALAFIAPTLVGGREAPGPLGGAGVASLADAYQLRDLALERCGDDVLIRGEVARNVPAATSAGTALT
jgi:diaminohydroxyphosphoribosylaminopyrimidine deaminase/5-amino-6-(5-phosphoribosylamino)uracil reductase